ncbi:MAG: hypothetical protein ACI4M6_00455 [Christensenellaceae bacterium]
MNIFSFLFKPKKEMAKKDTKHVRVGRYTITPHAQNRIVDKSRNINKIDVIDNLFTKPNAITPVKIDEKKRPSYNRIGKRATTSINPKNNYVVSCRPVSKKDRRDFDLVNVSKNERRKKYVKRSSKK